MSVERFFSTYHQLRVQTEAFAALGARLGTADDRLDPAVLAALDEVIAACGLPDAGTLTPDQQSMLADMIRSSVTQARAGLDASKGDVGWGHTDVAVLDGQGRASTNLVPHIARLVDDTPMGEVLDVGTGVGLLAIAVARHWPDANIVGIDVWKPALARARHHVAEAGLEDRIEIRHQDVTTLTERDRYDCGWIPAPFLPADVIATAIRKTIDAVKPGGLVAIGVQRTPDDPLAAAVQRLRNISDTGVAHTVDTVLALCRDAGLDAAILNPEATIPIAFVGGRV